MTKLFPNPFRLIKRKHDERTQRERPPRPRSVPLVCGLALLWTVHGYSSGGSQGLLTIVAIAAMLAAALPVSLPSTMRTKIWSYVATMVLCLAANLDKLGLEEGVRVVGSMARSYDRFATIVLAVGVAALFFRPSKSVVTLVGVSIMPMISVVLGRTAVNGNVGAGLGFAAAALALVVLVDQFWRASLPRAPGTVGVGVREWGLRILLPSVWFATAAAMTPPVVAFSESARGMIYDMAGFNMPQRELSWRNPMALSIASPAFGFPSLFRIRMEIEAPEQPGYLRETVFRSYSQRQWIGRSQVSQNPTIIPAWPDGAKIDTQAWILYAQSTNNVTTGESGATWSYRSADARRLEGLCLPGTAAAIAVPDGVSLLGNSDGVVWSGGDMRPTEYKVFVDHTARGPAYPLPDPAGLEEYLSIPRELAPSVAEWVHGCPELSEGATAGEAIPIVVDYFLKNFSYDLGKGKGPGEPLDTFMEERVGHCTLFASAAALMLRHCGIPTRVVSGYYCSERHEYTGLWVVRERDGHAWCEAWDAALGRWRLVEATPPSGRPYAMPEPGRFRKYMEMAGFLFRSFVKSLRESNPLVFLALAISSVLEWGEKAIASPWAVLLLTAALALFVWRIMRRRKTDDHADETSRLRDKVILAMRRLERRQIPRHLRRDEREPWSLWWKRVSLELPPEHKTRFEELLEEYQTLRYREPFDSAKASKWLSDARQREPRQRD